MNYKTQYPRFDINAAVVFRLGEELITDVVQALVELVKNSYDADATWVKVTIDTIGSTDSGSKYAGATGVVLVEDNGHGMDRETLERGWLTIANSPKRAQKAAGRVTQRGRTPIGDKGLGRLGSQRLARNVEIVTRPHGEPTTEYYVAFSWTEFRETTDLSDVPVTWESRKTSGAKHGTKLVLSGLRDPGTWQGARTVEELQRKLSAMISPFQQARDFRVHLEVDGHPLELAEIAERVRETSLLKYRLEFDRGVLRVSGAARLNYLQPNQRGDQGAFNSLCREDGGKALYTFLAGKSGKGRPSHFTLSKRAGWFVEFNAEQVLGNLDRVRHANGSEANPGPFHGEVDVVSLDVSDFKSHAISRQSDYRRLVRNLAGIRVYRDGFGIRVGEDWLGLGKQWTRGTSYYGLRPANVLGYLSISARDNPDLTETTSREGFQVTPHYENFVGLLSWFVRFAGDFQEYLRRGVLQFLNEYRDRDAGVEPEDAHSEITRRIDAVAQTLSAKKQRLEVRTEPLRTAAEEAHKTLGHVRRTLGNAIVKDRAVSNALERLETGLKVVSAAAANAERMLEEASVGLDQAGELKSLRGVLDRRWETLQEELSALYESISLGLTAEILAHEIHNVADRLARKSTVLLPTVTKRVRPASVITYIEHVRSSVAAMRKQLAHLTPSLRYLREQRERIDMVSWAKDFVAFHNDRLSQKGVLISVQDQSTSSFRINMNKGKLTQVFDNLVLNAEYWLKEAIRTSLVEQGRIQFILDGPMVRVFDTGKGVEESVEESLFEPFVTTKRAGEGRGLGLFVARQLLDSESCGIALLSNRNTFGRRYVFELDLSGAVSE